MNGQLKNQSSIMPEDYEESISLTLRTWSSRKPLRMQEENWKHQWLQPCFARHARKTSMGRPGTRLMISSLNLRDHTVDSFKFLLSAGTCKMMSDNAHRVLCRSRPDKKNHSLCNAEIRSVKKGNIGFKPTREHNFFTHFATERELHKVTFGKSGQHHVSLKIRRLDHCRSKAWSESRGGLRYPLIVQDENTNLIQGYLDMSGRFGRNCTMCAKTHVREVTCQVT